MSFAGMVFKSTLASDVHDRWRLLGLGKVTERSLNSVVTQQQQTTKDLDYESPVHNNW